MPGDQRSAFWWALAYAAPLAAGSGAFALVHIFAPQGNTREFYAAVAQIVPVLFLAFAIETRVVWRGFLAPLPVPATRWTRALRALLRWTFGIGGVLVVIVLAWCQIASLLVLNGLRPQPNDGVEVLAFMAYATAALAMFAILPFESSGRSVESSRT